MAKAKSTKSSSSKSAVKKPAAKKAPVKKAEVKAEQPPVSQPVEQAEIPVAPPEPAPNLKYSSDEKFQEPPRRVRIGMKVIELPEAEVQRAGFYSPHAEKLARTIKAYKLIQPKG